MSTLKTTNLQNADASSANIVLGQGSGGGATISGVTTATTLKASTGTFTGDVDIADSIIHTGDTDTKIRFPSADTITAETGGSSRFKIDSSGNITIGNDGDSGSGPSAGYDELCIEGGNENIGMCFLSPAANTVTQQISFGDSNNNQVGRIIYNHNGDYMAFHANNTERLRIDMNGNTNISGITTATSFVPTEGQLSNRNIVINGDMRIAQRGTSTTSINEYLIDRWRSYGGALGATWSQQTDATAYPRSRYALRQHRTASNSQTNNTGVGQGIETKNSLQLAGQTVTLSFKARCGANFSAASNYLTSRINGGEGTDENPFGMTNTNGDAQNNTLTTSVQRFTHTWTIPSDKTQITVLFDYTPVGTAGAQDWFEIAEVQLEVGSAATPFEYRSHGTELRSCMRYCQKVFNAQLIGTMNTSSRMRIMTNFPVPMRGTPSYTRTSTDLSFQKAASNETSSDTTEAQGATTATADGVAYARTWDFGGFSSLADRTFIGGNGGHVFTLDSEL